VPTASESKVALTLVSGAAVADSDTILRSLTGSVEFQRSELLAVVPNVISYYSEGSAALAADFYEDERDRQGAGGRFAAVAVVADRTVRVRRAVAWASDPLFWGDRDGASARLSGIVRTETNRPYRDTILDNRARDPKAVGWRRVTQGKTCGYCAMLADRGAVYKETTATFAAHGNCDCTAQPVFLGGAVGPEANAMQYLASSGGKSARQKAVLRQYLAANYGD
jgi:hypothetical protein